MALNLNKSTQEKPVEPLNLTKSVPNSTKYKVGLAWDADFDLDASVVVLDAQGKRSTLVYFDNLAASGIVHQGDALDGDAEGDDEVINIDLSKVEGERLIVTVTSYNSGTFGATQAPVASLYLDDGKDVALVSAPLDSSAAFSTALAFVEFFRENGEWKFKNLSETLGSSANGLEDVVAKYA